MDVFKEALSAIPGKAAQGPGIGKECEKFDIGFIRRQIDLLRMRAGERRVGPTVGPAGEAVADSFCLESCTNLIVETVLKL